MINSMKPTHTKDQFQKAWSNYREDVSDHNRNVLIEMYMYIVERHASRIDFRTPKEVNRDDLVQSGVLGLINAVERFDFTREVKFATFANSHVFGAMVDSLRYLDSLSRQDRHRNSEYKSICEKFLHEHSRMPSPEEVGGLLNVGSSIKKNWLRAIKHREPLSFSGKFNFNDNNDLTIGHSIEDQKIEIDLNLLQEEFFERILGILFGFERAIIYYYYKHGLSMIQIGHILRTSESRVSQLHSSAIEELIASGILDD